MNIIRIAPGDYERYESLVLQKEQLEKDAVQYDLLYMQLFGALIIEGFSLKIDCIALKKEIAIYVRAKNAGKAVSEEDVAARVKARMTGYRLELESLLRKKKAADGASFASPDEVERAKTVYRRLAKTLHPDVSDLTEKYPVLLELFIRVTTAYRLNDVKELLRLEVVVNKVLEENGIEHAEAVIPDVAERIRELEAEIDCLVNSEPYCYKKILEDDEAAAKRQAELEEDAETYGEYKKELQRKLAAIKEEFKDGR